MPQVRSITLLFAVGVAVLAGCGDKAKKDDNKKSDDKDEAEEAKPSKKEIQEAKNLVGAISRGAVGAYERESVLPDAPPDAAIGHALCKSAKPVPAQVPSDGAKVEVAADAWGGDETTGWKCLRFTSSSKLGFQLSYAAGSGFKGIDRGAKDPGADGYQVCAEADGKPGGKTTLICMTGKVDKERKLVKIDPELQTFTE